MRCERVLIVILVLGYCLGVHENSQAQQRSDPRVADLVQAEKLRAGVGVVAPHCPLSRGRARVSRSAAADRAGRRIDAQGRRQDLKTPVEQALMRGLDTA